MAGHLSDFLEQRLAARIQAQESKCWLDEGLGVARGLSGPGPDLGESVKSCLRDRWLCPQK